MTAAADAAVMAGLDLRSMSDEALAAMFGDGEQPLSDAAMAEMTRRDRAQKRRRMAAQARAAAEAEWIDAAHAHFLAAEAACAGNLTAPGSRIGEPFPGLYRISDRDFWGTQDMHGRSGRPAQASEEMREFCRANPRPVRSQFIAAAFAPRKGERPWDEPGWSEEEAGTVGTGAGGLAEFAPAGATAAREPQAQTGAGENLGARDDADPGATQRAAARAERAARLAGMRARRGTGTRAVCEHPGRVDLCADCPRRAGAGVAVAVPAALTARQPSSPVLLVRQARIDGAQVLDQMYRFTGVLGHWPSVQANVTGAVWAAFANGRDKNGRLVFPYSPRLFFTSPYGGSGKTRLSTSVLMLCPEARTLVESTKASFKRFLRKRCTIRVTELDNWIGPNGRRNPWLLSIGNTGYEPNMTTGLVQNGSEVEIETFGAMILDGLSWVMTSTGAGEMTKTFVSRAQIIWVERAPEDYRAPRLSDEVYGVGRMLGQRAAAWMAQEIEDGLAHEVPDMSGLPGNRPGALWEPLCMVADRAGGPWPDLIRDACMRLESPSAREGARQDAADEIETALGRIGATGARTWED